MEVEPIISDNLSEVCERQVVKQSEDFESDCDMFDALSQPLGNLLNQLMTEKSANEPSEDFDSDETMLSDFSVELAVIKSSKPTVDFCEDFPRTESKSMNNSPDSVASNMLYLTQPEIPDTQKYQQNPAAFERNCLSQVLPNEIVKVTETSFTKRKRRKRKRRWTQFNKMAFSASQPLGSKNKPKVTKKHRQLMESLNIIEAKFSSISILIKSDNHQYIEQADKMLHGDVKKRIDQIKFDIKSEENLSSDSEESERENKAEFDALQEVRKRRLEKISVQFEEMNNELTKARNSESLDKVETTSDIQSSQSILSSVKQRHRISKVQPKLPLKKYNSKLICVMQKTHATQKINSGINDKTKPDKSYSKTKQALSEKTLNKPFVNKPNLLNTTSPSCYDDYSDYDMDDCGGNSPESSPLKPLSVFKFPTLCTGSSGSVITQPGTSQQFLHQPKFDIQSCNSGIPTNSTNVFQPTNKVKFSATDSDRPLDFKDMFQRGFVSKGSDVLHCSVQGTNYAATVVHPGLIVSTDHDIYVNPQSWLNAVTKLTFSKDQAFSKIFYNGQSLKDIASSGKQPHGIISSNTVPWTNVPNAKLPKHHQDKKCSGPSAITNPNVPTRSTLSNPVDNLCSYLLKCKFLLPSDDELFVTQNLLGTDSDSELLALEEIADI